MGAIVSELLAEALIRPLDARGPVVPLDFARHEVSSPSFGQEAVYAALDADFGELLARRQRAPLCVGPIERPSRARPPFVETSAAGPEILCLAWPTLMAYLRIATHPRIFAAPLNPDEALGNVAALVGLPHVRAVSEQDGFLDAYKRVAGDMPVRGNLVPDAHVAAILFQHGVRTLYTHDRDFRKFELLEVRDPFS